ncbi:hypothetical protein [Pseudoflavonifractor sp. MSJ-37]|uniref:hypothetical protein n=1 Tax=Pseudoflavonifractor sp. MSJ-37 TaxID=2841531 RepID=UPI001C0F86F8|nr:hypothetical protein [Pseudoflavonifractor sp. MSJ-37]MBU5434469.1 hypothetical protein [Pseudoflavonifractor sp. MSJ-37]
MLNYIRAELWKAFQRPAFFVTVGVVLLLEGAFLLLFSGLQSLDSLLETLESSMLAGAVLMPPVVQMVDSGAASTLKNEVSCGIPRSRIYLGKLAAVLLLGAGLAGALLAAPVAVEAVLTGDGLRALAVLWRRRTLTVLFQALPIWFGLAGACHMAALSIRSAAGWIAGYYAVGFLFQPVLVVALLLLTGLDEMKRAGLLLEAFFLPYTLLTPTNVSEYLSGLTFWCWAVGMGWLAVTSAAGLAVLRRREIK